MANTERTPTYQRRQQKLTLAIQTAGLEALALNPGPSLVYLTGMHFHLMERPVVAIFRPHTPLIVILPELETAKTRGLPYPVQVFPYGEDPASWRSVFQQALLAAGLKDQAKIGLEPRRLRVLELRFLEQAAPGTSFISAEESLAALRMYKDDSEIKAMRQAVAIAEKALEAALQVAKIGMSERELAAELTMQLLRHGSQPELPFSPIVASGPNSANPHAAPSDRQLTPGDLLVIDWGATHDGYVSDITRTFAIGEPTPEMEKITAIVAEANAAGRAAARPGVPAGEIDKAARQVIIKAGYGQYFTHRTGHGLGMEGHEAPYIYSENQMELSPGMTFTVEPGIYLPGQNGVRIEDDVVITSDGAESLTTLPRVLRIIE